MEIAIITIGVAYCAFHAVCIVKELRSSARRSSRRAVSNADTLEVR